MTTVSATHEFLDLVCQSGLVSEADLHAELEAWQTGEGVPEEPKEAARRLIRAGYLTVYQAKYLLQGKWRNFFIAGKYKLLDLLGSGGMGRVYLCQHLRMGRKVALKVLPAELVKDPASVERFYREARALA